MARRGLQPTRGGARAPTPDVADISNWTFIDQGALNLGVQPANPDRDSEIEALKKLVSEQKSQIEEQGDYLEDLRKEQERFSTQVAERIEEGETKVGSRISKTVSQLNSKLLGPAPTDFKYKSSTENILRLNRLRELTLAAFTELESNYGAGFGLSSGAKAVQKIIEEIDDQEEAIKIAEASPLGYKLVEAYKDQKLGFRFVKDQGKAVELKKIEQELLKNVERKPKSAARTAKSRSRSRSRSRSPGRSSNKGKGHGKGNSGSRSQGACVWCGNDGHGYKFCYTFKDDVAAGRAVYDAAQRKFVRKGQESSSSGSSSRKPRSPSRSRKAGSPRRR